MLYYPRPLMPETKSSTVRTCYPFVSESFHAEADLWKDILYCFKKQESSPSHSRCTSSESDDAKYERAYVRKNPIAKAEKQYHGDGYFRG